MKTIKTQVFFIVLSGIITASAIIGGLGVFWSNNAVKKGSAQILDLMAQVQTQGLDSMFSEIEHASIVLGNQVSENLTDSMILQDKEKFSKYIARIQDISYYIANCTGAAISVFVRFSPMFPGASFDGLPQSILWHKKNGEFVQDTLIDFPVYNSDYDNSWYYKAQKTGKGGWTNPYYDDDLNEYVISYGNPVYKNGELLAVVGMNIDFDDIASLINSITIYDSGYAFLTDENFVIAYHRSIPAGTQVFGQTHDYKLVEHEGINSKFYEYTNKGKVFRMLYKNLANGMRLVVSVPAEEIDRARTRLIYSLIISVFAISIIVSLWSVWASGRFTKPLKQLSVYARNIIAGDYDVDFSASGTDELNELMGNFSFMAKSLKRQFEYINSLVYLDAMTGAKNKRAFMDVRDDIDARIRRSKAGGEKLEFAVVVFDVNNLKYMNDNFGHKAGDMLIKNACNLITKNFIYSPVFRIGGDEFVTILTDKDYKNRIELLTKLRTEMDYPFKAADKSFDNLSLASGMAEYNPDSDDLFHSVFERADAEMYKAKIAMKGGKDAPR